MARFRVYRTIRINVRTRLCLKSSVESLVAKHVIGCSLITSTKLVESILILISIAENND
jgi:hypothetical protein